MPTTSANPFAYGPQRIKDTALILDSFILFAHLFVGGMQLTTLS